MKTGMLKIHSGGSNSQQTVLTIPANQLKQLGVAGGSGPMQTILMPLGKGKMPSESEFYIHASSKVSSGNIFVFH